MGLYIFENVKTGEIREIFFKMNDIKVYNGESNNEIGDWERRYSVPFAGIDTNLDPFNGHQFVDKTGKSKGTMASLLDHSRELSEKRKQIIGTGVDPLKEKAMDKWEKDRIRKSGQKPTHPSRLVKNFDITT